MRRFITLVVLVALLVGTAAPAAHAGNAATNAALGLASFAVFNQLVAPLFYPRPVYAYSAYAPYPRPVVAAGPPAFAHRRVIHHPHGRYALMGDGLYRPYRWVWMPAAPHRWTPAPPPLPAP